MTYEERKAQVKSYLGKLVTLEIDRPAVCFQEQYYDRKIEMMEGNPL